MKKFKFYALAGLFWLVLWLVIRSVNNTELFLYYLLNESWRTVYVTIINVIFLEIWLPKILKKRRFAVYNLVYGSALFFTHLMLLSFGLYAWKSFGTTVNIYTQLRHSNLLPENGFHNLMDEVSYQSQAGVTSFLFFGILNLFYVNFQLRQKTQQLLIEKKSAELNFLKAQTNPHFLFNTLNNIYSLAKGKSDLTAESVLKLSKLLRFMLYDAGTAFITIKKDIEIIKDYLELEKLRYDETLKVSFEYDVDDMNEKIPPLIMMPLVENAFKHGASEDMEEPFVRIRLVLKNQFLNISVENSFQTDKEGIVAGENIGLTNLRRQLALLYTDFQLDVQSRNTSFVANLRINLSSHV